MSGTWYGLNNEQYGALNGCVVGGVYFPGRKEDGLPRWSPVPQGGETYRIVAEAKAGSRVLPITVTVARQPTPH